MTGWGDTIAEALRRAYAAAERVRFEGMQYRRDIGYRAFQTDGSSTDEEADKRIETDGLQ